MRQMAARTNPKGIGMGSNPYLSGVPLSSRRQHVANVLRSEIVSGALPPGGRMSTHLQLVDRFGVSALTGRHALNDLIRDGFLYSIPRTYVVPNPPHLNHYAIAFHTRPSQGTWPQFWLALSREAIAMPRQLSVFYGIHGWTPGTDYQKLIDMVRRHQVAGVIFTSDPHTLIDTPLLTEPGIPRVALTGKAGYEGVTAVDLKLESFARRVAEAIPPGKRRAALVTTPDFPNEIFSSLVRTFAEGVELEPEWTLAIRLEDAEWARNAAYVMMSAETRRRPNVVIITDDNLVPHATAGIAASGVRVPNEVEVIAHGSFPWPTPSAVKIWRVGYDARTILRTCIDIIDAKRAGREVPNSVTIPAIGEDEPAGSQTSGVPAAADVLCGSIDNRRSPGPRSLAVRHRASVCEYSVQRELLRRIK